MVSYLDDIPRPDCISGNSMRWMQKGFLKTTEKLYHGISQQYKPIDLNVTLSFNFELNFEYFEKFSSKQRQFYEVRIPICLAIAQLIKSLAASTHVHSCVQEVRDSKPWEDKADSGFHPIGICKMSSSPYIKWVTVVYTSLQSWSARPRRWYLITHGFCNMSRKLYTYVV